jgi:hypothetical protein
MSSPTKVCEAGTRRDKRALSAVVAGLAVVFLAAAARAADEPSLAIENRSEHPVKVALPGTPAATVPPGDSPVSVAAADRGEGVGVTARLWWVKDPRALCQIYTPWGRTITVTGSREILCRSR